MQKCSGSVVVQQNSSTTTSSCRAILLAYLLLDQKGNPSKQGLKRQKRLDLDLKVLKEEKNRWPPQKKACFSSSKLELPADLPSVEEQLKVLAAALKVFSFLESL